MREGGKERGGYEVERLVDGGKKVGWREWVRGRKSNGKEEKEWN